MDLLAYFSQGENVGYTIRVVPNSTIPTEVPNKIRSGNASVAMDVHPAIGLVDVPEESSVATDGNGGLTIEQDPFFGDMGTMLGFGAHIGSNQELISCSAMLVSSSALVGCTVSRCCWASSREQGHAEA